jgi:hypothetical protein
MSVTTMVLWQFCVLVACLTGVGLCCAGMFVVVYWEPATPAIDRAPVESSSSDPERRLLIGGLMRLKAFASRSDMPVLLPSVRAGGD